VPHKQMAVTISLQATGGQPPAADEWHLARQRWPQARIRPHSIVQTTGSSAVPSQGPEWHTRTHLWPQDIGRSQARPHDMASLLHCVEISTWRQQRHALGVKMAQGGHSSVLLWHRWLASWPQARRLEQGNSHGGSFVPQGTGGYYQKKNK